MRISRALGWRLASAMAFTALIVVASAYVSTAPVSATTANRFTVQVGNGGRGIAVNQFLPTSVVVNEGDVINWTNPYPEPHTVSFNADKPAPTDSMAPVGDKAPKFDGTQQISSGFLRRGDSYETTLTKAGKYTFLCLIHAGQTIDVTVVSPGLHVPTQAQIDAQGKAELDAAMPVGDRLLAGIPAPAKTSNADGTTTWTIPDAPAVPTKTGSVTVMAFVPQRLSVGVGDTITWLDTIPVPHTVTFTAGGPPRSPVQVVRPAGGLYDGSSYVNSGQLGNAPGRAGTSFSLTFTKAGAYPFICILHVDQGMAGVVEVGTPSFTPPATGDGGFAPPNAAWPLALLVALMGGISLVAMRVRYRA